MGMKPKPKPMTEFEAMISRAIGKLHLKPGMALLVNAHVIDLKHLARMRLPEIGFEVPIIAVYLPPEDDVRKAIHTIPIEALEVAMKVARKQKKGIKGRTKR